MAYFTGFTCVRCGAAYPPGIVEVVQIPTEVVNGYEAMLTAAQQVA
jgi:hypothetical protein